MQDCELFINKLNELNEEDQKEELGYKLYPILEVFFFKIWSIPLNINQIF